ncbi:hypothetical protein J7L48_01110 [bacterium]|nr:hypothetical protein [bacterium]
MAYKFIQFKIGKKILALEINFVHRFFKVKNELLPYPGESKNFQFIISLKIGAIPVLKKEFSGIKGASYGYLIVAVHDEKKLGILCDEIIGLAEEMDKKAELIDIENLI